MIKCNKKLIGTLLAVFIATAHLGVGTVFASTISYQTNSKISQLETSFQRNYLGSKNLPTFRLYLSEAKSLVSSVTSTYEKNAYLARIAQCEIVIQTIENVVNMESSIDRNYKGTKNLPTFQAYLDRVNSSLAKVTNSIVHSKLSERSYAGSNVIRDIRVMDSGDYIKAASLRETAIELINVESIDEAKTKASEALNYVWKCETSFAKDAIASELKSIRDM
ncbi:hypothetical protein [Clostridium cylindrosporum]|uniref:Chemotaxis methyl-accepting receptor HlyB-like 4HB MCP domain-containing protein n=1 Tax=Clostridium cylindrosporum DSM 605 TaxID=1121307 RepID=A0A0J8D9Y5_CLOCY|nr:hypothetical protein [Clostridium cylindrosporum]KMT22865.1 hypothetical protein CLCY_5c01040 [Clostridium cylindrosporum DSM 605]